MYTRPHGEQDQDRLGTRTPVCSPSKPSQHYHPLTGRPSHPLPLLCSVHCCFLSKESQG